MEPSLTLTWHARVIAASLDPRLFTEEAHGFAGLSFIVATSVAGGAQAEPTKPPVRVAEHAAEAPLVFVASVATVKSPVPIAEAQGPANQQGLRTARVTTSRGGAKRPTAILSA